MQLFSFGKVVSGLVLCCVAFVFLSFSLVLQCIQLLCMRYTYIYIRERLTFTCGIHLRPSSSHGAESELVCQPDQLEAWVTLVPCCCTQGRVHRQQHDPIGWIRERATVHNYKKDGQLISTQYLESHSQAPVHSHTF